jgi:RNA polymerase sigma-70 factor (sigma-E family)
MDDDSFRDFVRQRLTWMSQIAFLLTGDHHDAEDLVQCALVKLHRRWPRLTEVNHLDNYLRKVLYHEHVSLWRRSKHKRAEWSTSELPDRATGDDATGSLRRLMLEKALERLTRRQRAVVVLRFFEDMSEADTAEAMGCTVGTVKSQTHLALKRLREQSPELIDLIPGVFA